jgi:deazaflavin-dependent oxidoreductase (nitroreductase family)
MPVSPTIIKLMSQSHLFWYRLTNGLLGGSMMGMPFLLLTTTGRKSGRKRTTPLQYLEDGNDMVVIASNGGHPRHPSWYLNLEKNPEVEVQVRRTRMRMRAAAATGADRERLWKAAVARYGGYEGYQMTTTRKIPVVVLKSGG